MVDRNPFVGAETQYVDMFLTHLSVFVGKENRENPKIGPPLFVIHLNQHFMMISPVCKTWL